MVYKWQFRPSQGSLIAALRKCQPWRKPVRCTLCKAPTSQGPLLHIGNRANELNDFSWIVLPTQWIFQLEISVLRSMGSNPDGTSKFDGGYRSKWGYRFKWTDQHLSEESMHPLRFQYDRLGAAVLERLQKLREALSAGSDGKGPDGRRLHQDLYVLLRDNHQNDRVLTEFWEETHTVPEWVDWAQLARGQEFFHRYIAANITGFALQGFVGENSASSHCFSIRVNPRLSFRDLVKWAAG